MKDWNEYAQEQEELLRQTLRELAAIPAPSGHEERRKAYCESWLDRYGIPHESGNGGNLLIPYRIQEGRKNRVVTAHMDIVFEESVPLKLQEDGAIWRCPGIGDNTANVVLLLLAAKYLYEGQPETEGGLWLIADTCEEGLGNLAGSGRGVWTGCWALTCTATACILAVSDRSVTGLPRKRRADIPLLTLESPMQFMCLQA